MLRSLLLAAVIATANLLLPAIASADQPKAVKATTAVLTKSDTSSTGTPADTVGFHHRHRCRGCASCGGGGGYGGGYGYASGYSYPYYSSYFPASMPYGYGYGGGYGGGYYGSYPFPMYNAYSYYWPRGSMASYSPYYSYYGLTNYGYGPYMYGPTGFGVGGYPGYGGLGSFGNLGYGGMGGSYFW